jgi:hypothetical protein
LSNKLLLELQRQLQEAREAEANHLVGDE